MKFNQVKIKLLVLNTSTAKNVAPVNICFTSHMKTSIILNEAFSGNTEAKRVKNQDEAYIAVWNPWNEDERATMKLSHIYSSCTLFACFLSQK